MVRKIFSENHFLVENYVFSGINTGAFYAVSTLLNQVLIKHYCVSRTVE